MVGFGLLRYFVVSEVVTGKGEIIGLVSTSALPGFSGSSAWRTNEGLTNELFLRCTTPSAES